MPILSCDKRGVLVTGGGQAGKSMVSEKFLLKRFPDDLIYHRSMGWPMPLIYWLVAEDYSGTQREYEYLVSDLAALQWLHKARDKVDPGIIEIGGGPASEPVLAIVKTKSAKDYKSLRMEAPAGILGCEASQLEMIAYDRLRERMAPHRAWMLLSGTVEMSFGWYVQLAKAWRFGNPNRQSFRLPSYSNTFIYPEGINDPEIISLREDLTAEQFGERIEGVERTISGLVFPEFNPDFHVQAVEFDANYDVQIWEDPGYGTESAHSILAVQIVDNQVRVIDEIYKRGITTENLIDDFVTVAPWWKNVVMLVGDPHYGSQHHGTESVDDIWHGKTGFRSTGERVLVKPRIERTKTFLGPTSDGVPRFLVAPHCKGLLSEAGMLPNPFNKTEHPYRWKTDRDGEIMGNEPEDRYNHSWEAVGRGLIVNFGNVARPTRRGLKVISFKRKRSRN